MPANLTPQYHKAEEAYRRATSPDEELSALQVMLREVPKHKGTDKLQAELKQKISRAKEDVQSGGKASGKRTGYRLPSQGAGRVLLVGPPNTGKSQLLKALTRAEPAVGDYPFTTVEPLPGMMLFEDVQIQLVDTPPITSDVFDPVTQGLMRGADLVLAIADLASDDGPFEFQDFMAKLESTKTRLGRESKLDENDLGVSYTQSLVIFNKSDDPNAGERGELYEEFCPMDLESHHVSATTASGLEELTQEIFRRLDVIRVYTKSPKSKEPDFDKPFTVKRGATLLDVAELIHHDLAKNLKNARVWGSQVHDGTMVKGDYVVSDRDIVEIQQ